MAVIDRAMERQVRSLRFASDLEQAYQASASSERLTRMRITLGTLAVILGAMTFVPILSGHSGSGSSGVGAALATLMQIILTGLLPIAMFLLTFWKPAQRFLISLLAGYLILTQIWFGVANMASPEPITMTKLSFLFLLMLVLDVMIVTALRAPTWLTLIFTMFAWGWTTFTGFQMGIDQSPEYTGGLPAGSILLLFATIFLILGAYFNETNDRRRFLLSRRLEDILSNTLPASIAERLKVSTDVIAEYHSEATVLFADIAGFTQMSMEMEAGEVVGMLNEIFSRFDELVEASQLEKIKTVGDAYMVAAGVPHPLPDHTRRMVDLALEMRGAAAALGVSMRIGIHRGPVVAGVIGTKKYLYDLWGATVNIASRMESSGLTGEIQVTEEVIAELGDAYETQARGVIDVKGVGDVRTHLVLKRKVKSLLGVSG